MASEIDRECPGCEEDKTFYRAASTQLHLGLKTKWRCPDCGYCFVRIDGDVDTSDASA